MTIYDNINRIAIAKEDIISTIEFKGVDVPENAKIEDLPQYIEKIEGGAEPFHPASQTLTYRTYDNNLADIRLNMSADEHLVSHTHNGNVGEFVVDVPLANLSHVDFRFSSNITELHLPEDVDVLGLEQFRNQIMLKKINIPMPVVEIPSGCFRFSGLEYITFDDNSALHFIQDNAFRDSRLKYIEIPDNCELLGNSCFQNCNQCIVKFKSYTPPTSMSPMITEVACVFVPFGSRDVYIQAWGIDPVYQNKIIEY